MRTRRRVSHSAQLPIDFDAPAPPRRGADRLATALERHAQIEGALRTRGPNPYPDEIEEEGWSRQLPAFHFVGPLEATLLQDAEAAAEALTEMLPEQEDDYPAGPADPTQAACFLICPQSR